MDEDRHLDRREATAIEAPALQVSDNNAGWTDAQKRSVGGLLQLARDGE